MIPRLRLRTGRWLPFRRRERQEAAVVKGRMRNIIVVTPPDERFQEAFFILRDDYLAGEEDRSALLRQAVEIAQRYTAAVAPPVRRSRRWLWLLPPAAGLLALGLHLLGLF